MRLQWGPPHDAQSPFTVRNTKLKSKNKAMILAALILLGGTTSVCATNLQWLNYSPVRFFTDQDWQLAKAAARNALDNAKDGETVEWKNAKSGNFGSLTPIATESKDGTTCRMLKIANHARDLDGTSVYEFCQRSGGRWAAVQGSTN